MSTSLTTQTGEFSFRTRQEALSRFRTETFDLLVIGGGITGVAVARDAASRGLSVALVEKDDFATGTSSRSSKLIHGGLRYLENFEFGLVFEALSERALLLRTAPHMVRPLPFYLPVYRGDANGRFILSMGLWLYDLLALFRSPEYHKRLSRESLLAKVPFLRKEGLLGGFRYYDASMWDDVLVVETARAAARAGAQIATRVEAIAPLWEENRITGFRVRDREAPGSGEIVLRAKRLIVCGGPWTDQIGERLVEGAGLGESWRPWLSPSKGVHLVFDLKRLPVPGAMVMSHPDDGRISFVMPRPDFGAGVVIVGTTDGPSPYDPEKVEVEPSDIKYLMDLLNRYFPELKLTPSDILSAFVGIRPLVGERATEHGTQTGDARAEADNPAGSKTVALQKVSREHRIDRGPGGSVIVAGGKYTTHRKMAEEIVDFALDAWRQDASRGNAPLFPKGLREPHTKMPVNPEATPQAMAHCHRVAGSVPRQLVDRYGANALEIVRLAGAQTGSGAAAVAEDPNGFPFLEAQLRFTIRKEMVLKLEDFYFRRMPLYLARADHGKPWVDALVKVWAEETGATDELARREKESLLAEIARRSAWRGTAGV